MEGRSKSAQDLLDVFRQLDVLEQEFFVSKLGNLRAARLVCKDLRAFVDGGVKKMNLCLAPKHKALLEAGQAPPDLPRCSALELYLITVDGWRAETNAAVLQLFVLRLPQQLRERITSLEVDTHDGRFKGACLAISGVLPYLPNLTDVYLGLVDCEPYPRGCESKPLQRQLLYETLAALPRLESLSVSGLLPASGLAAVAKSALGRRLKRFSYEIFGDATFDEDFRSVAHMEQLTELRVFQESDPFHLGDLLNSLPPSLEILDVDTLSLTLTAGTITSVKSGCSSWLNSHGALLLHCRAMGSRLDRLSIHTFDIPAVDERPVLAELMRRSDVVEVEDMYLESKDVTEDDIRDALQLLPCWPRNFSVSMEYRGGRAYGRFAVPWGGEPLVQPSSRPPSPPEQQQGGAQELEDERELKSRVWAVIGPLLDSLSSASNTNTIRSDSESGGGGSSPVPVSREWCDKVLKPALCEVANGLWAEICSDEAAVTSGGTRDKVAAQLYRIWHVGKVFDDLLDTVPGIKLPSLPP